MFSFICRNNRWETSSFWWYRKFESPPLLSRGFSLPLVTKTLPSGLKNLGSTFPLPCCCHQHCQVISANTDGDVWQDRVLQLSMGRSARAAGRIADVSSNSLRSERRMSFLSLWLTVFRFNTKASCNKRDKQNNNVHQGFAQSCSLFLVTQRVSGFTLETKLMQKLT